MKRIIGGLFLVIWIALLFICNNSKFNIPPLGKLLNPTHGVWKNGADKELSKQIISTPNGDVSVYFDDRQVPHIFAPNQAAMFYAQGFVQAQHRLFQMDFQTRIGGGNLAAAIGEDGLGYDRYFRRIGLSKVADEAVDSIQQLDTTLMILTSFSDGVNAYIDQLKPKDLPIEFKLSSYKPEPWTVKKSIILLKLMAFRLSGNEADVANTNVLNKIGKTNFDILFPDFPLEDAPIIPDEKYWNFRPIAPTYEKASSEEPIAQNKNAEPLFPYKKGIGSNNWAVGTSKTKNNSVILCNDPHLWLSYPSIWYEMQLHAPDYNVYGVTIPGAPTIIIGFNENIAWGVTNGTRDAKDWFALEYEDDQQDQYIMDGKYHPISESIEKITVKNGKNIIDTVAWTEIGPIPFDNNYRPDDPRNGLALNWIAHQVNNEINTFYSLNKAKNYDDYQNALSSYADPSQNFVYGDVEGNIAIKAQGKFLVQQQDDGKFIQNLEDYPSSYFEHFIPFEHNPQIYNPKQDYVFSANQHHTNAKYPYYYTGIFEHYRNRRINQLLDSLQDFTIEDMMWMQNDNFNLMGKEITPFLLANLDKTDIKGSDNDFMKALSNWDYFNDYNQNAPAYFQTWWRLLEEELWDELVDTTQWMREPLNYYSHQFLANYPEHPFIDNKQTDKVETVGDLVTTAFHKMTEKFVDKPIEEHTWGNYNQSKIRHLMELEAFSTPSIAVGGSEYSINANNGDFGPSWRMIVELNDDGVDAYGVYPGGQSGNPSDEHYDDFVEHWRTGKYFKLNFYADESAAQNKKSE